MPYEVSHFFYSGCIQYTKEMHVLHSRLLSNCHEGFSIHFSIDIESITEYLF